MKNENNNELEYEENHNSNSTPSHTPKVKKSNIITKKLIMIAVLSLVLLIPSAFIMSVVKERQSLKNVALSEISSKKGKSQNISGPVLVVPIKVETTNPRTNVSSSKIDSYATFYPSELNVKGNLTSEILHRSIYKSAVYSFNLNFDGEFQITDYSNLNLNGGSLDWSNSKIEIDVTHLKGATKQIYFNLNGKKHKLGTNSNNKENQLTRLFTNANISEQNIQKLTFDYELNLDGSQKLFFSPIAESTNVSITSDWTSPSFDGEYLPKTREITSEGFNATWGILNLNINSPQQSSYKDTYSPHKGASFGVNFLIPVDSYKETTRSIKYMILFIALTFLVFFFVEITNKQRIHPIQYLLVGISLVLFYLLLISISEHTNFIIAYIISTISTVMLISFYSLSVFKSRKFALLISGKLFGLYCFLYVLLRNQDYSLLMGSVTLFLILGAIMYFSRNINWYSIDENN